MRAPVILKLKADFSRAVWRETRRGGPSSGRGGATKRETSETTVSHKAVIQKIAVRCAGHGGDIS